MKNLLMIAPYFVPRRRVGALRPFKFAAHLSDMGWNISVVTIASNASATANERNYLNRFNFFEVSTPFDNTGVNNQQMSSDSRKDQIQKSKRTSTLQKAGIWIDRNTPMDTWIYLLMLRYGNILSFAQHQRPDVIWATGDPWSGLWLGGKLSEKLRIPIVADFRDPWTLSGQNLRKRSGFSASRDRMIERRIVEKADRLVFTAQSTADLYINHYRLEKEKTDVIYNSFCDLDRQALVSVAPEPRFDQGKFHILFLGSFRRLSPPTTVLEIIRHLRSMSDSEPEIEIHSFGNIGDDELDAIDSSGFRRYFRVHQPVAPEILPAFMKQADLLLVTTSSERKSIIPAKLWDYMKTEKPILAVAPNPEIGDILTKAGGGVYFKTGNTADAASFICKIMQPGSDSDAARVPDVNREVRATFSSSAASSQLNRILREVSDNGNK